MTKIIQITALIALISVASVFVGTAVFAAGSLEKCNVDGQSLVCDTGFRCEYTSNKIINPDNDSNIGICIADLPEGPQAGADILLIINTIANWVFGIFLAIATIFIVIAAFEFVTGTGDPTKIQAAKQKLIYALVGIGLALIANGMDDIIRTIINP